MNAISEPSENGNFKRVPQQEGAFVAEEWLAATRKNFPDRFTDETEMPGRNGFKGEIAPDDVLERFVGTSEKRIANEDMKHVQNPVRYWNI